MTTQRHLHFTTPGLRPQIVAIAPNVQDAPSKRQPAIVKENDELERNLKLLDQETKARNRAFQDRIDEVWSLTAGWEAKLKTEAIEAMETILNMKSEYQQHLETFQSSMFEEIDAIFDRCDKERLPSEENRCSNIQQDMTKFYKVTGPTEIQAQAGEVNRKLRKMYETFHIEQQKEIKRDQKLVARVNKYFQSTAQRFEDESALQRACFYNLEDDIIETFRPVARMFARKLDMSTDAVISLQTVLKNIQRIRSDEDLDVLDTVIETQQLLQQIVVVHFGLEVDDIDTLEREKDIIERIQFPRLAERLLNKSRREDSGDKEISETPIDPESLAVEQSLASLPSASPRKPASSKASQESLQTDNNSNIFVSEEPAAIPIKSSNTSKPPTKKLNKK